MRKQFKFVGKDGYSANLCGNYFTKDQVTDYLPIVQKFPDYFEEVVEDEKEQVDVSLFVSDIDVSQEAQSEIVEDVTLLEPEIEKVYDLEYTNQNRLVTEVEEDVVEKLDEEQDDNDEEETTSTEHEQETKSEKKKAGRKPKGK